MKRVRVKIEGSRRSQVQIRHQQLFVCRQWHITTKTKTKTITIIKTKTKTKTGTITITVFEWQPTTQMREIFFSTFCLHDNLIRRCTWTSKCIVTNTQYANNNNMTENENKHKRATVEERCHCRHCTHRLLFVSTPLGRCCVNNTFSLHQNCWRV